MSDVNLSLPDVLAEDPDIRGQKYVCLSFISPEKILENKEVYIFGKFIDKFSAEVKDLFISLRLKYPDNKDELRTIMDRYSFLFSKENLQNEYKYFMSENADELTDEFNKTVDFKTNVRGIKVRGSYETLREAQVRAEVLKRGEKNLHYIYIAEVGCWCPWDPNPDNISDQQYHEDKLNTLMHKYRENQEHKNDTFAQRKNEMLGDIDARNIEIRRQNDRIAAENELMGSEIPLLDEEVKEVTDKDTVISPLSDRDNIVIDNYDKVTDSSVTASLFDKDNIEIPRR